MSKPHRSGAINPDSRVEVTWVTELVAKCEDLVVDLERSRTANGALTDQYETLRAAYECASVGRDNAVAVTDEQRAEIANLKAAWKGTSDELVVYMGDLANCQRDLNRARDERSKQDGRIKRLKKDWLTVIAQRDDAEFQLTKMTTARDAYGTVFAELKATRDGHTVIPEPGNRYDALYQQALIMNMATLVGRQNLSHDVCIAIAARAAHLTVRKIMDHANEGGNES